MLRYRRHVMIQPIRKIDVLQRENAELRKQLKAIRERLGISPYGCDKIDHLEQTLQFVEFERDNLKNNLAEANAIVTELTKAVEWMKSTGDYFRYKAPEQIDACKLVGAMYATAEHALSTIAVAVIKEDS